MLKEPNIYEADFKGFFDNVNRKGLKKVLKNDLGIPEEETMFIEKLNQSVVKLSTEHKLDETRNIHLKWIKEDPTMDG